MAPVEGQAGSFPVVLTGEIDLTRQDELQSLVIAFRAAPQPSARVDLGAVTFMDSTGLGLLSQLRNVALERGGDVTLVDPPLSCVKILRIVGFDQVFPIETTSR